MKGGHGARKVLGRRMLGPDDYMCRDDVQMLGVATGCGSPNYGLAHIPKKLARDMCQSSTKPFTPKLVFRFLLLGLLLLGLRLLFSLHLLVLMVLLLL